MFSGALFTVDGADDLLQGGQLLLRNAPHSDDVAAPLCTIDVRTNVLAYPRALSTTYPTASSGARQQQMKPTYAKSEVPGTPPPPGPAPTPSCSPGSVLCCTRCLCVSRFLAATGQLAERDSSLRGLPTTRPAHSALAGTCPAKDNWRRWDPAAPLQLRKTRYTRI